MGLGAAAETVHAFSHAPAVERLVAFLSLSHEANLPTWYASSLLLVDALLLGAIARRAPDRRWAVLAAIFGYLSLDEAVELHEHLGGLFATGGVLYFDWVIPAGAALLLLGAAYLPFLRRLPAATRRAFVLAAVLYVGGALLMELPLGWWTERAGDENPVYAALDLVEESLELAGASVFLLALRDHLRLAGAR